MLSHFSTHVISEDLAVHTQSFTANTAIKLELNSLVLITMPELLRLFVNINPLMLRSQLRSVIILVTLQAKMGILSNTVHLG